MLAESSGERPVNPEEAKIEQRSKRGRLFELDALRGLAAFAVILFHLQLAYTQSRSRNFLYNLVTSGQQAVELFFVLSGYVLGLPYWKGKQLPYGRYLVRRFFRIYVPFFFALLVAWFTGKHFLYSRLPMSAWFYATWQQPFTWKLFAAHLLIPMSASVNTAFWSLRLEMEFSILLPLCCLIVRRVHAGLLAVVGIASYLLALRVVTIESQRTLQDFPLFFLGLLLSLHTDRLAELWQSMSRGARLCVFVVSVVCYVGLPRSRSLQDLFTGLGSAGLILCAIHSPKFSAVLRHALPEYLGRISFSLYLVHATVLFATLNLLFWHVPRWALSVTYLAAAICLAHLFCVCIEEPMMKLGRRLTSNPAARNTQRTAAGII